MNKKIVSFMLVIVLLTTAVFSSYASDNNKENILTQAFIRQQLFRQYSLAYDTFNAAITLEDGTEITGIGFTDYSSYYETDDETVGYFPAGFIADYGYTVPTVSENTPLVIENLDFTDDRYQFLLDCETVPYMEHCVRDGQYLKYGINEAGSITYEASTYIRGICDESLGALFSFDTNQYVFDPDMGNYIQINGITLFDSIDFYAVEEQINQIIADQNNRFVQQDIVSYAYIAQEAITSYLLSMQEETFLGYRVKDLIEYASQLNPMQCIRITPDGLVIVDIQEEPPKTADELTKWLVGIGCFIVVAGSTALNIFVPAARPLCGAITGAAIDVFLEVVIENKSLEGVKWEKVAVAAVAGATMSWLCPLAASGITSAATKAFGSVMGKLAGYGFSTLSNSLVSGATGYLNSVIDGKDGWNAFLSGVKIGGITTVAASLLAEAVPYFGPKIAELLSKTKIGTKINNALNRVNQSASKAGAWIKGKQIHLPEKYKGIENVLVPKSVHQAAECAKLEINKQTGILGGKYSDLTGSGDGSIHRHEMPSFKAYNNANGITDGKRGMLPSIKMDAADHMQTASFGMTRDAIEYRAMQAQLISEGQFKKAFLMDIEDITSKFGSKYDVGLAQALDYASTLEVWK